MTVKKYDESLVARVEELREGLGPQPLAALWFADPGLREIAPRARRILSKKVFPGDAEIVERMFRAKEKGQSLHH